MGPQFHLPAPGNRCGKIHRLPYRMIRFHGAPSGSDGVERPLCDQSRLGPHTRRELPDLHGILSPRLVNGHFLPLQAGTTRKVRPVGETQIAPVEKSTGAIVLA